MPRISIHHSTECQIRYFLVFANSIKDNYKSDILKSVSNDSYVFSFVIRGGILTPSVMENLKKNFPSQNL